MFGINSKVTQLKDKSFTLYNQTEWVLKTNVLKDKPLHKSFFSKLPWNHPEQTDFNFSLDSNTQQVTPLINDDKTVEKEAIHETI